MRGSVRALDGGRPPWRRSVRGRVPALARGRAPRGPSAVDAAAAAAAAPAQPAAEGVAGGRAASVPLRGASVVRAFDGRRGSLYSPRLSEGSATRAPGNGPWGSRGRRPASAPPGRRGRKRGTAPRWEPPPRSGPVSERTSSGCLLDGAVDAGTSCPRPRYTP